jgi:hypothetical protein
MKAFMVDRYGTGARVRAAEMPEPVMNTLEPRRPLW